MKADSFNKHLQALVAAHNSDLTDQAIEHAAVIDSLKARIHQLELITTLEAHVPADKAPSEVYASSVVKHIANPSDALHQLIRNAFIAGVAHRNRQTRCMPIEVPAADTDGWIQWSGGECPVPAGSVIDFRMRHNRMRSSSGVPEELRWTHEGIDGDIIAYRLQKSVRSSTYMHHDLHRLTGIDSEGGSHD
jgi:hypothetical protein